MKSLLFNTELILVRDKSLHGDSFFFSDDWPESCDDGIIFHILRKTIHDSVSVLAGNLNWALCFLDKHGFSIFHE